MTLIDIIQHVSEKNKKWASTLSCEDIANILDTFSLMPESQINKSSQNIGLYGEMKFEEIFKQNMPSNYKLVNTSKTGRCGDFIIKYSSMKTNKKYFIIVDIKNYKTPVPTKEIEKFHRDIHLNNNLHGGLLLSYNSKISGMNNMIDFHDFTTNNGIIQLVYAKIKQADIICETIHMICHIIELKDINRTHAMNENELTFHINELNNEIQLISNSRDVLHSSKILIEKNMNEIMMNLLQCEYTISNRIKQINNLLINKIKIAPENDIKSVIRTFKNSIDVHYENLLYEIYRFGWDNHKIDLEDKTWELNGKLFIKFKFYKKYTDVIISDIDISIIDIEKTKYKQKKDGIHIKLNPESFELIKKICN